MLKLLELVGFKSFADKTRFEFTPGISAVVGPNGSGKSNVVDAIRWILGEQSAKSLRGKEMTDVIFNGSGSRRSLGMAEVSLYFDNSSGVLPFDSDEVVLTRRVYRSGEGEYLINGQVARLRDFRDLFLGTGADAYCIIEQGKVELMLQASNKDRRQIFEEAAGTSRYRVKKIESLRRLDRVEQNLLRLGDIRDELEKQLKTVRNQAGKAHKYKELSEQLRTKRIALALTEFDRDTRALQQAEQDFQSSQLALAGVDEEIVARGATARAADERFAERELARRIYQGQLSQLLAERNASQERVDRESRRATEVDAEWQDSMGRGRLAQQRAWDAKNALKETQDRYRHDSKQRERLEIEQQAVSEELSQIVEALVSTHGQLADQRNWEQELGRRQSETNSELAGLSSRSNLLKQQRDQLVGRIAELAAAEQRHRGDSQRLQQSRLGVADQLRRHTAQSQELALRHAQLQRELRETASRLKEAEDQRIDLAGRIDVLTVFQERHEGLDGGVRRALELRGEGMRPWTAVIGVVADVLRVAPAFADLVEIALGPLAQALILPTRADLGPELYQAAQALPGRVQFVFLDERSIQPWILFPDDLGGESLASYVECDEQYRALAERLLGATFLVSELPAVVRQAWDTRWITPTGESMDSSGIVSAGPARGATGLLSRAAELRELGRLVEDATAESVVARARLAVLEEQVAQFDAKLADLGRMRETLVDQSRILELAYRRHCQESDNARSGREHAVFDLARVEREFSACENKASQLFADALAIQNEITAGVGRRAAIETEANRLANLRQLSEEALGKGKVGVAILDERLATLRTQLQNYQRDELHWLGECQQLNDRAEQLAARRRELKLGLLRDRMDLAEIAARRQQLDASYTFEPGELETLSEAKRVAADKLADSQARRENLLNALHGLELKLTQLRMGRDTLLQRIRDEYGLHLGELWTPEYQTPTDFDADTARSEVNTLREKIQKLGPVNVEAAAELEELELRSGTLQFQMDDLVNARKNLHELIEKINEESRRMFLDTFETVRSHFQEIYRKLFGGGRADILLEDGADILESGIEIIARPPGKEPRSISLLSGGEKTMTAVALLLALFRTHPSPFCVLDEVDAALDESNIGRFIGVLSEFAKLSQFILITHSKTTMASASVLHGVTQREPGVSLRVSVRLEDVGANGEIRSSQESLDNPPLAA